MMTVKYPAEGLLLNKPLMILSYYYCYINFSEFNLMNPIKR